MVERPPYTRLAGGSSPSGRTRKEIASQSSPPRRARRLARTAFWAEFKLAISHSEKIIFGHTIHKIQFLVFVEFIRSLWYSFFRVGFQTNRATEVPW